MRSALVAKPRGKQEPRLHVAPVAVESDAAEAIDLAAGYGLTPDEWQEAVLQDWLARETAGLWASSTAKLSVARQNGKNGAIEIRELYGTVILGEKFLHTAHEVKTAMKHFTRLKFFFGERANDPGAKFPELNALVKSIRSTNGQEAIFLTNGGSVELVARSRGSGRGYTVDVLVCDEDQELTEDQLEALLPTVSSAPLGNPQVIFAGTPPGPNAPGTVTPRLRETILAGKAKRTCMHEWSVEGEVDITDRRLWFDTNPALGGRLQISVLESELSVMSEAGFARERLGRWPSKADLSRVFPGTSWTDCRGDDVRPGDGAVTIAIDVTPDDLWTAIATCRADESGEKALGRIVRHFPGVDWVVAEVVKARAKYGTNGGPVLLCGRRADSLLRDKLEAADVETLVMTGTHMQGACADFYSSVVGTPDHADAAGSPSSLVYEPNAALDSAVAGATQAQTADGWYWKKRGPVDISPLVALTAAVWAFHQLDDYDPLDSVF